MSIEQNIKDQYSKIFKSTYEDWIPFKQIADYYFKTSSLILKKDIDSAEIHKLWLRNVQKRLYLGIASELLLKAIYLMNGYNINRAKKNINIKFPEKIDSLKEAELKASDTYSLNELIDNLSKIIELKTDSKHIIEGLKICKIFRNKEGHVAVHWHTFERESYAKIEKSIVSLYKICFNENLDFIISVGKDEIGVFEIK